MRRALTLIEMLAVLVVLALAATLTLGFAGSRGAMTRRAAESALLEALASARAIAAQRGGAEVRFGDSMVVRSAFDDASTREGWASRAIPLPRGWNAQLDGMDAALWVDPLGCSSDARIVLRGPGDQSVLQLQGLSGRCSRDTAAAGSSP